MRWPSFLSGTTWQWQQFSFHLLPNEQNSYALCFKPLFQNHNILCFQGTHINWNCTVSFIRTHNTTNLSQAFRVNSHTYGILRHDYPSPFVESHGEIDCVQKFYLLVGILIFYGTHAKGRGRFWQITPSSEALHVTYAAVLKEKAMLVDFEGKITEISIHTPLA